MNRVMKRIAIFPFLLVCLAFLAAGCGSDGAYPKKKGSLRIVQYNIGAFSKEIENSIPLVAARRKELHADAISLNELDSCNARHTNNQVADFAAEMGGWNHRFSRAMPYREGAYGVGVAVPDEVLSHLTVALPKGSGSEPRACCVVETPRYVLASTHLDFRSEEAAVLQAKIINDAVGTLYGNSEKPVFLAGDMNFPPDSKVLAELRKDWTVLSVQENSYPSDGAKTCIDYILGLNNKARIKVVGSGVPVDFEDGDVAIASDHLPVYLDVEIRKTPFHLSRSEKSLVAASDSLMAVMTVSDPEDSLILRRKSIDFSDKDLRSKEFKDLAAKMLFTVQDPSQDGVGIAAPQVGLNRRVVCVQRFDRPGEPFGVYPNARLDSLFGEKVSGREGCLSIPGWAGSVPRYQNIIVSYTDPKTLERVKERVEGFTAVIFQHEIDHLDGILYTDRADSIWVETR